MAIFEVCFENGSDEFSYVVEGNDAISVMMEADTRVNALNETMKASALPGVWEENQDALRFTVSRVAKTELIRFDEEWVKEFVKLPYVFD